MGSRFKTLNQTEQTAVATYVRAEYDKLVSLQPATYVAKNARADSEGWQESLRELIAADPKRVRAIIEAASRTPTQPAGFTLIELSIVLVIIGLIVGGCW